MQVKHCEGLTTLELTLPGCGGSIRCSDSYVKFSSMSPIEVRFFFWPSWSPWEWEHLRPPLRSLSCTAAIWSFLPWGLV